jgi:phage shock protein PspC (stress-responsive transcriptional regulator)
MNPSEFGQEADDPIPPQSADQGQQDQQITDQPPQANQSGADQHADEPPQASQPTGGQYQPRYDYPAGDQPRYDYPAGDQPLYRPIGGRMIAGVAAGIAQYLGVDVTIVRIVLAVLTFVGGAGVPVYVAGWLLIPDEGASQSIASELIGSLQGRTS